MIKVTNNLKKLNVLYVEDDVIVNRLFTKFFKKYVKNFYNAFDGIDGLTIFKTQKIDIVITDIQMPRMNGIEMIRKIKEIKEEIPIIVITAFGDNNYLYDAIDIGVDGYILKPIDKNKLLIKLNKIADNLVLKKELENYMKLMEIVFDYQTNALLLIDKNFNIVIYNKSANEIIKGRYIYLVEEKIKELKNSVENYDEKILCVDCNEKFYELKIKKIDNYFLINCIDITQLKREMNKIEDSSLKDELTGAYNRKKIDKTIEKLKNKNICIIMFDIDNFKKINDTYGHLKGDEVLKRLSEEVHKYLRKDDIFVRWGGEEFLILVKNLSIKDAKNIAEKLRKIINSIEVEGVGHFSCSFGVACGKVDNLLEFDKLLKKSDDALYLAKNRGKNRVEVFN